MVDICLELPDELISRLRLMAAERGQDVEGFVREQLERAVPAQPAEKQSTRENIRDEPIVKAAEVETECRRLGYQFGWRFITCPQANASRAKLLLISLNPAGRSVHGPAWSQEAGSAYRVESWGGSPVGQAPLQRQIQAMFAFLGLRDEEVFSAHYVPFRSPSWAELDRRAEAERFASRLWAWLLPTISFDRVVCVGKDAPGKAIARLLDARLEASLPVGWGNVTADRYRLPDRRIMVALPHLSRFGVFGRGSDAQLMRLFAA